MKRLWILLVFPGLISCQDSKSNHIDLGIYYGVPSVFVDQIVATTHEAGEEVRELDESFEVCFEDAVANSTADWIIIVVNSTAHCPSSPLPDNVLLLQYDVHNIRMILPDSSMDLQDTIRDFLEIEEEDPDTPSSIFTPSFIAIIVLCLLAIALNVCCLLSKNCKRLRMKIRDSVGSICPCLRREKPQPKPENPPMPTAADPSEQALSTLPTWKDTWTKGGSIKNLSHEFTKRLYEKVCDNCSKNKEKTVEWRCSKCHLQCHENCKNDIVVPCIPKEFRETDHIPNRAPYIFTPLIVLVASIERRLTDTHNAGKDVVKGVYHYDPKNDSKLKFHLSDFNKYVRTVRCEKNQLHYMAANLKDLLRINTYDEKIYGVSPLIPYEVYCKLVNVSTYPHKRAEYIKILTNTDILKKEKRDTLAYLMLHLYKVENDFNEIMMDRKRLCWELYPSIFGLRKVTQLEFELKEPKQLKQYRDIFMDLLNLGESMWRRFFIYQGMEKCTIVDELKVKEPKA